MRCPSCSDGFTPDGRACTRCQARRPRPVPAPVTQADADRAQLLDAERQLTGRLALPHLSDTEKAPARARLTQVRAQLAALDAGAVTA